MSQSHINEGRIAIQFPVCHTISYHHALKIGSKDIRIANVYLIVVVNSVDKVRDVDTSIRFTGDV